MMVTPDWAIAAYYRPARAQPLGRRESSRGADPSRSGRCGDSPATAATVRSRTRVRARRAACAAGQIDAYAWACPRRWFHACVHVGAGAGVGARVKTRVRGGASSSTCWGYHRRCRVTPAGSGFCYPGDQAKAVTRSRGDEGAAHPAGGRRLTTWGDPVLSCSRTV